MIRNDKGISLIEVSIAIALVGVMGLGMASMFTEMGKQQNAANVKALLASQKLKIESLIKDSKTWAGSVGATQNNSRDFMTCLRTPPYWAGLLSNNGCQLGSTTRAWTQTGGTANGIALTEANGVMFYDSTVQTNGFDARGRLCAGWPSNSCPIRWDISVTLTCPNGVTTCLSPTVQVVALVNIPQAQQEIMHLQVNPENYKVDVTRGVGTRFDPILITEKVTVSTAGTHGAGPCTGGSVDRKFSSLDNDPAQNIVSVTGATGQVVFRPGSYQCRITAPAFKVGNHTLQLINVSAGNTPQGNPSGPALSPQRYSVISNAILEVSFVISANTTFKVQHNCQYSSYANPSYAPKETNDPNLMLGFAQDNGAGLYSGSVVFATWACYRNG